MAVSTVQDPTRGEVRVETGAGLVKELRHSPGARNAQAIIQATHTNLREDVTGWADTTDEATFGALTVALAEHRVVEYRIEVRRKANVDPTIKLADVGRRDKVRDLVKATIVEDGASGHATAAPGPAQTSPAESRPVAAPAPPAAQDGEEGQEGERWLTQAGREATEARQAHRSAAADAEARQAHRSAAADAETRAACRFCSGLFAGDDELADHMARDHADRLAAEEAAASAGVHRCEVCRVDTNESRAEHEAGSLHQAAAREAGQPASSAPAPAMHGNRGRGAGPGALIQEGKAWERHNSDGSLNFGSWEYQGVLGTVELAYELSMARQRDVAAHEGKALQVPEPRKVKALAAVLLRCADRAQAATRDDGRTARGTQSHTRARGAVRTALDVYPVPWDADADGRKAWEEALGETAAGILRIASELMG